MKGLSDPSQLTNVKLNILINTPIISKIFILSTIKAFKLLIKTYSNTSVFFYWPNAEE